MLLSMKRAKMVRCFPVHAVLPSEHARARLSPADLLLFQLDRNRGQGATARHKHFQI